MSNCYRPGTSKNNKRGWRKWTQQKSQLRTYSQQNYLVLWKVRKVFEVNRKGIQKFCHFPHWKEYSKTGKLPKNPFLAQTYKVTVFRGKFEGIRVNPCLEQSTIAPSLAQVHTEGHKSAPTDCRLTKRAAQRASNQNLQPKIFMVEASFFTGLPATHKIQFSLSRVLSLLRREARIQNWGASTVKTSTTLLRSAGWRLLGPRPRHTTRHENSGGGGAQKLLLLLPHSL